VYTDWRTAPGPTNDARSRSETAYGILKRRLLAGDFPFGERLAEAKVAQQLGVSRTPVREALTRLHAENLVERHPDGGFRPSPPDLLETHELYQVRLALELHAVRLLGSGGASLDLASLRDLRDQWADLAATPDIPVDPGFVLLDEHFHISLAAAAGNDSLVDTLIGVNERIRPVRMHDFLTAARIAITIVEHRAIVESVLQGDLELARTRLEQHLQQSLEIVRRRAAEALARMVAAGRTRGTRSPEEIA
jgi:DNA-binding GntR family transcriptional regulator